MKRAEAPRETHLLFVYGTLMEAYPNHARCLTPVLVRKIGRGRTLDKFAMTVPSFPIVLLEPKIYPIHGELYEVHSLELTDRLEGHPRWYQRVRKPVEVDGKTYIAWIYTQAKTDGLIFKCGDWRESEWAREYAR